MVDQTQRNTCYMANENFKEFCDSQEGRNG